MKIGAGGKREASQEVRTRPWVKTHAVGKGGQREGENREGQDCGSQGGERFRCVVSSGRAS